MEDEGKIAAIFAAFRAEKVRFSAKSRVFESYGDTKKFIQFLVDEGCELITVHARLSKLKMGCYSGDAKIREICQLLAEFQRENSHIQFVFNGGIYCYEQIKYLQETYKIGVMSGQILLQDPFIFCENLSLPNQILTDFMQKFTPKSTFFERIRGEFSQNLLPATYEINPEITKLGHYDTLSGDKMTVLMNMHKDKTMLFDSIERRILRVQALLLLSEEFLTDFNSGLEAPFTSIINHAMQLIGRDLLRWQVDLRGILSGKKWRNEFKDQNEWFGMKIQQVQVVALEVIRRLQEGVCCVESGSVNGDEKATECTKCDNQ